MSLHVNIRHMLAAAVVSGFFALPAQAQYVGPTNSSQEMSVGAILKNPVDDQDVTLQGYLLRKIKHEKYIFSDGTGEIVAEID